jgi:hypothetical protein
MAIEIVEFHTKNGGSFHSFLYVYQRVMYVHHLYPSIIAGLGGDNIYFQAYSTHDILKPVTRHTARCKTLKLLLHDLHVP